jgi:hypothetical protein
VLGDGEKMQRRPLKSAGEMMRLIWQLRDRWDADAPLSQAELAARDITAPSWRDTACGRARRGSVPAWWSANSAGVATVSARSASARDFPGCSINGRIWSAGRRWHVLTGEPYLGACHDDELECFRVALADLGLSLRLAPEESA